MSDFRSGNVGALRHCGGMRSRAELIRAIEQGATFTYLAQTPKEAKALGRQASGFDQQAWEDSRYGIVVDAGQHKFGQHDDLREFLLNTGEQVLVEASPRDRIWGVGLGRNNPAVHDPRSWRGLNLLGFALCDVRDVLARATA
jgi:ribA/ribD-fused uncharacterized protein